MSERTLDQQNTLLLVERWLEVSKEFELITYAEWWRKPLWWLVKSLKVTDFIRLRKLNGLALCRNALVGVLAVRYDGIMRELFTCAGAGASFNTHFMEVWMELQGRAVTAHQPGLFSTCLWEILQKRGAVVSALKPKFMLRQFVDDMPGGEPSGALKALAYSYRVRWPEVGAEAARMVKDGYALLHNCVRARLKDIELLTGGVLNARMVDEIGSPYVQYHRWLFYVC